MGELFAGPGYRTCSHSGCRWPAVATLGFDYSSKLAWLEELQARPEPATYDLCSVHAERFGPPRGWRVEDRRFLPEPLFQLEDPGVPEDLPRIASAPPKAQEAAVSRQAGLPEI